MKHTQPLQLAAVLSLSLTLSSFGDGGNAGIGKYPGAPGENFAPELVTDNSYATSPCGEWHTHRRRTTTTSRHNS